jgi:hypothetical protein
VAEAARLLNTSAEAIRSRVKRGTLESIKEGKTVYVLLDTDQAPPLNLILDSPGLRRRTVGALPV